MPIMFVEAPSGIRPDAKQKLMHDLTTAIDEAYHDLANTDETLILIDHYPLENAAWAGRLGSARNTRTRWPTWSS